MYNIFSHVCCETCPCLNLFSLSLDNCGYVRNLKRPAGIVVAFDSSGRLIIFDGSFSMSNHSDTNWPIKLIL